ncbi:MAG: hypothetical protein Ct9H300mP1_39440 [Planctomycetaceae bacterium]|nr:MAG: hypothetical protein Ct9H300mP1_39440 [Planctomycetaceae bacterium]
MATLELNVVMDQSVKVRESIDALWIPGVLGACSPDWSCWSSSAISVRPW